VLIDFGITSKLGESSVAGGTPEFMDNLVRRRSRKGESIKITPSKDFYPFSILCIMLLEAYPPFRFNAEESHKEKEEFVRQCT
jgi:serine/threonine protein kinase